jgi:xylulokinase
VAEHGGSHILGIDLGTGGPKVALVSIEGEIAGAEFEPNEIMLSPEGGAEQDPVAWWTAITTASRRLMERGLVPIDEIAAVGVTTQWSGTVAVDPEGEAIGNAIIWMDTRGSRYIDELTGGVIKIEGYGLTKLWRWLRLTGGIPAHSGKDPVGHILFLKHERPEVYERAHKLLEPKDYINFLLTGRYAASYDSIALHWVTDNRDIRNVRYDEGLLALSGIDRRKLPDLLPAGGILGKLTSEAAEALGVRPDIPVAVGTPDVQSAAVGSGAVRDFEGHLYVGTSSWLTCHVPYKKTDLIHNMASLPSAIPGRYLIANEQETAGACLTFLKEKILYHQDELLAEAQLPDVYKIFDRIAERVPAGSGGLLFMPWLYGERTPIEDHSVRGGFLNLSLDSSREHMIRAVMEGVAYNARWLLEGVERFIGRPMNPINFIGGGANSAVWCQIFADVFDRTIRQVEDPIHANIRGAALLAAAGIGRIGFDEIGSQVKIAAEYSPRPENRAVYDMMFRELKAAYKATRKIYARLNRS